MLQTKTHLLNKQTPAPITGVDSTFKATLDQTYVRYEQGLINSVLLKDDKVYATVRHLSTDEHPGHFFNAKPSQNEGTLTMQEIFILTNINPIGGNILSRYKGKSVLVTIKNDLAIFASLSATAESYLSEITPETVKGVRDRLNKSTTDDIFSEAAAPIWRMFGVAREKVLELQKMIYNPEEHEDKVITIEGEGNWGKDVAAPAEGEVQIPVNSLMTGLNGLGMKTNLCHMPTTVFSAK